MIFHPFLQYFRRHILPFSSTQNQGAKLRMPNQRMSCDCQMIFLSKSNKFICLCEIITVLLRMHFLTLHTILCYNSIKLFLNYAHSCLIPTGCLSYSLLFLSGIYPSKLLSKSLFLVQKLPKYQLSGLQQPTKKLRLFLSKSSYSLSINYSY